VDDRKELRVKPLKGVEGERKGHGGQKSRLEGGTMKKLKENYWGGSQGQRSDHQNVDTEGGING